jgi:hypothetical protein
MTRSIRRLGCLGLLVALAGCSNNPSTPSTTTTTTPPPVTTVIYQNSGPVPALTVVIDDFSIPSAGTLNATVDWTFATSQVAIAVTTLACNDPQAAFLGSCSQIGTPQFDNRKPKTVSGSAQPGGARLWLANLASVDESMAAIATLTRTSASSGPSSQSLAAGTAGTGRRVSIPLTADLAARLRGR